MIINKILAHVGKINIRSVYVNLRYLPLAQAVKLPIMISNNVYIPKLKGRLFVQGNISSGMIKIGYGSVGIFDNKRSRSVLELKGTIIFKGKAEIGHGTKMSIGETGILTLGHNFKISAESTIVVHKKVDIGENCLFSWDVLLMDTDFHAIKNIDDKTVVNPPKEILVGNNVWIGCRCLITKGARIPNNSIVAANTHVTNILGGEGQVFGGNPAKVLKENVLWER